MTNHYEVGARIKLQASFTVAGVLTDPTAITLKVKTPSNVITTYTYAAGQIIKSATGIYYKEIDVVEDGAWHYRWESTGVIAVGEAYLEVNPSEF